MEGQTEGQMDRPYFTGPFQLPLEVQKQSETIRNQDNKSYIINRENQLQFLKKWLNNQVHLALIQWETLILWHNQESKPKLSLTDLPAKSTKNFKGYMQLTINKNQGHIPLRNNLNTDTQNSLTNIVINELDKQYHQLK